MRPTWSSLVLLLAGVALGGWTKHWLRTEPPTPAPSGEAKDTLLKAHATQVVNTDFNRAISAALSISDPAKIPEALKQTMRFCDRNNIGEALRWIEQSGLPEAQKAELTKEVKGE